MMHHTPFLFNIDESSTIQEKIMPQERPGFFYNRLGSLSHNYTPIQEIALLFILTILQKHFYLQKLFSLF